MDELNDFQEDRIDFTVIPSLKHIVIVKIVTELWTQDEDIIERFKDKILSFNDLKKLEIKILNEKVQSLRLPDRLKIEVSKTIAAVGLQLFQYLRYVCQNTEYRGLCFPRSISWTMEGRIDEPRTFLQLPSNSPRDFKTFYFLSKYCLKNNFIDLWDQMSKQEKDLLYQECLSLYRESSIIVYKDYLLLYWTCYAKNELHEFLNLIEPDYYDPYDTNRSIAKNMFLLATVVGNVHSAKYFWHQLTLQERDNIRSKGLTVVGRMLNQKAIWLDSYSQYADTMLYLLSKLKGTDQREILKAFRGKLLKVLLRYWPWRHHLLPIVCFMCNFLTAEDFVDLLNSIVYDPMLNQSTGDLLVELFRSAPNHLKSSYIIYLIGVRPFIIEQKPSIDDRIERVEVFWRLVEYGCFEAVQEFFRHGNEEERKHMLFLSVESVLTVSILRNNISLLNKLTDEFLSSESEIKGLRERIIGQWGTFLFCKWLSDDNFEEADIFLSWVFTSQEEITNYKKESLDKFGVIRELIRSEKPALIDKFVKWCFGSDQETCYFKQDLLISNFEDFIFSFSQKDWDAFQNFVAWCAVSEEKIIKLKKSVSDFEVMGSIIRRMNRNSTPGIFDFKEKFLMWCFHSQEKITNFRMYLLEKGINQLALNSKNRRRTVFRIKHGSFGR